MTVRVGGASCLSGCCGRAGAAAAAHPSALVAGAMTHFGDARKLEWLYAKNDGAHAEFALKE